MSSPSQITLDETPGRRIRVLVGDSVFESAEVTIFRGHLRIDFDAEDLETVDIDLRLLGESQ